MNGLFYECSSLKELPDISKWDINNESKIKKFIINCSKEKSDKTDLKKKIAKWIRLNMITNMSYLFYECSSLKELPDISKWNLNPVIDIRHLFYGCKSLKKVPDISKWHTKNFVNIDHLFYGCLSLEELPDISKWNTNNILKI